MTTDEPQGDEFEVQRRHPYAQLPEALLNDISITATAVRVYALIDRYVGNKTSGWPSRTTLATRLNVSTRTIDACLSRLAETGWIEIKARRRRDGSRGSSLYILSDSPAEAAAAMVRNATIKTARDAKKKAKKAAAEAAMSKPASTCETKPGSGDMSKPGSSDMSKQASHHEVAPEGTSPTSSPSTPPSEPDVTTAAPPGEGQSASVTDLREGSRRSRGPQAIDTTANRSDVTAICEHLAQRVGTYSRRQPEITHAWRDAARRLIDVDKADPEHVHQVIEWATRDAMWRSNVIDPTKLRKHYDTLWIKAKQAAGPQPTQAGGRPTPIQSAMNIEAIGQQMAQEDARRAALAGQAQFEVTA